MGKYKSFLDIPAWKKSRELTLEIYKISQTFPKQERYGLVSQIRRAVTSIEANIAEGFYRNSTKDLIRFLYISRGSCGEVINFVTLCKELNYISEESCSNLLKTADEVARQLNGWINSLKKRL